MNQLVTGKFIALKRKQKNLTQEQLAEKLGVSNKTISKWETGKCMPDYSIVKSLCEELEVTVAELMDAIGIVNWRNAGWCLCCWKILGRKITFSLSSWKI